jgi:F-type H+-transporting ATPase subunit delta
MAETLTIARPYAEAAFKLALELGQLPSWSGALARLATVADNEIARDLAGNPRFTAGQVAAVIADAAGKLSPEQANFVRILADNERLDVLPEISAAFDALRNEHEGIIDAHIASAYPLNEQQVADIIATLSEKYGKQVKASVRVQPDLIGGVSIRIGDQVLDTSVRGKLAQLASAMKV